MAYRMAWFRNNAHVPSLTPARAGAAIAAMIAAAESFRPSLTPRSTVHQAILVGAASLTASPLGAAIGTAVHKGARRNSHQGSQTARLALVAGFGVIAVARARRHVAEQRISYPEWAPVASSPVISAATGLGGATGIAVTADALSGATRFVGHRVAARVPGSPTMWAAVSGVATATAVRIASKWAMAVLLSRLANAGRAADGALASATRDPYVSGGPDSLVPYDTLSREGRRFVSWRVDAGTIASDLSIDSSAEPIRVFVGLDSAETVEGRVDIAISELDRLGAWSKSAILAVSPAGSGYANSVPVEALEYLSHGDCASVVIQYGVLPSLLSEAELPVAAETFRRLVDQIIDRSGSAPKRPRLLVYGESLGAQTAQKALQMEPTRVNEATAEVSGVDAALFAGTPGGPSLRDDLDHHPRTIHVDRWQELPSPRPDGVRLWFLDHDADPVTRFELKLWRHRPKWVSTRPRGRGIPDAMTWIPMLSWQQVALDVAYATQAQSGDFRSVGHDYRADLPGAVAAAFAPEAGEAVGTITRLLVRRELERDRVLGSEA
ncbi:MAG: alpha/beta-hydrolase family protein [Candidatus Nanopelagicales bacterium]|nr:alpha/beta-hydrolase family protein [Candidatus Nanopelagicales bacterium]MDZ4250669.1 alpha/beta-hydrolase family protein [Candidatus Nanopelagicales bacterium]